MPDKINALVFDLLGRSDDRVDVRMICCHSEKRDRGGQRACAMPGRCAGAKWALLKMGIRSRVLLVHPDCVGVCVYVRRAEPLAIDGIIGTRLIERQVTKLKRINASLDKMLRENTTENFCGLSISLCTFTIDHVLKLFTQIQV